uniref:Uncharacterized protein n=1 Tax=Arundo donax TaxID=35708 RepID=A0A0A9C862_ARUDO
MCNHVAVRFSLFSRRSCNYKIIRGLKRVCLAQLTCAPKPGIQDPSFLMHQLEMK